MWNDYKELINIKWIFECTDNNDKKQYEEGLPHTRENIIFLTKSIIKNNEENLINTLIHEKIHIYQRNNKNIFDILNNMNGFVKINYSNKYLITWNLDLKLRNWHKRSKIKL